MPPTQRPTDLPDWATSGLIEEPGTSEQDEGWVEGDIPPPGYVNWAWNRFSNWARHVADTASRFATLESAYTASLDLQPDPMAPGVQDGGDTQPGFDDLGGGIFSAPGDTIYQRGQVIPTTPVVGLPPDFSGPRRARMVATGRSIIISRKTAGAIGDDNDPTNVFRVSQLTRDLSAEVLVYFTGGPNEQVRSVISDGTDVIVARNRTVQRFNHDTGTFVWGSTIVGASGIVAGMAYSSDGQYIHVVSDVPNSALVRMNRTTGVIDWIFDHGNQLDHVAVGSGGRLFVGGPRSVFVSLASIRCIEEDTYFDQTNEGGLGDSYVGGRAIAWNNSEMLSAPSAAPSPPCMATDDRFLYCARAQHVWKYSQADGVERARVNYISGTPDDINHIMVDEDFVILITGTKETTPEAPLLGMGQDIYFLSRQDLSLVWMRDDSGILNIEGATTDGHTLFVQVAQTYSRLAMGKGPRLWRRANAGLNGSPTVVAGRRGQILMVRGPHD